jgi:hypothetical protein
MNRPALISLSVGIVLAAVIMAAGCMSAAPGTGPTFPASPAMTLPGTPSGLSCGLTTCHGLDLACGPDAPEICTEEYRFGDKCRQYARCDSDGMSCTLVTDARFASCRACVEQCAAQPGTSGAAAFDCEAQC